MERILIAAGDSKPTRIWIQALQQRGYDVMTAENGEEALAILKKEEIHLVISEVQMPKTDGYIK